MREGVVVTEGLLKGLERAGFKVQVEGLDFATGGTALCCEEE